MKLNALVVSITSLLEHVQQRVHMLMLQLSRIMRRMSDAKVVACDNCNHERVRQ